MSGGPKNGTIFVRHKFESGPHSHVKLHFQDQHVSSLHITSQLNLFKNLEMPDVLKKGVRKFDIVLRLKLNNYSKCLISASTALIAAIDNFFNPFG